MQPATSFAIEGAPMEIPAIRPPRLRGWAILFGLIMLLDAGIFIRVFDGEIPFNYTYDITPKQKVYLHEIMDDVRRGWPDRRTVFEAAIKIQEDIGRPAIPSLIEYTRDDDSDVRCFAVEMLGVFEDDIATDAAIAALQDEEPIVAFYATMALGTIGDPAARDPLAAALDHPDYRVRASAALNLSIVGMENRHVEAMIAHLGDPSERVNESIQESLTVGLGLSDMLLGRSPEVWAQWWEETGREQANLPG